MRKTHTEKQELLSNAIELMKQGKNNKEISQSIGITEKTVGKWLNPHRKNLSALERTKTLIIERVNKALQDKQTPISEISKLLDCIIKLKSI